MSSFPPLAVNTDRVRAYTGNEEAITLPSAESLNWI